MLSSKKRYEPNKQPQPQNIKVILFDLGNTLYDKSQYIKQAFREISSYLAKNHQLDYSSTYSLLGRIWKIKTSHYEFLLSDLLQILGIYSEKLYNEIIDVYHNIKPVLKPYRGVKELLKGLKKKYKLVLLTNGHPTMQENKIVALGLNKSFNRIIYTAEHLPGREKPDLFIYRMALTKLKVSPQQAIFVGDNPYHDFKGAKEIGIYTVRLLQGEFKNIRLSGDYEADIAIKNLLDLRKLLR